MEMEPQEIISTDLDIDGIVFTGSIRVGNHLCEK